MFDFSKRFLVVFSLLVVSAFSFKYAISDFYFDQAKGKYASLDLRTVEDKSEFDEILTDLNKSLSWSENNAKALDLIGDLLYQQWWIFPDGQYLQNSELLQRAEVVQLKASKLRPKWAFSAAHLMMLYSQQEAIESDFSYWFERSYELGRYETSISLLIMQVGLEKWSRLTKDQKIKTVDATRISIEKRGNKPREIRAYLKRKKKLEYICEQLADTKRKELTCNQSNGS